MSTNARILRPMPTGDTDPYDVREFPRPPEWAEDAACTTVHPDVFFSEEPVVIAEAKVACRRCPVREKCLRDALGRNEEWGVYGGMSPAERRQVARGVA